MTFSPSVAIIDGNGSASGGPGISDGKAVDGMAGFGRDKRVTLRFSDKELGKLDYWAEREGMDRVDFIMEAVERYAGIESGNYQLPSLEIQRLNQLVEIIKSLSQDIGSLETIVTNGFASLTGLARGEGGQTPYIGAPLE